MTEPARSTNTAGHTVTSTRLPLRMAGTISSSQHSMTRRYTSFMHSVLGIMHAPSSLTRKLYLEECWEGSARQAGTKTRESRLVAAFVPLVRLHT